MIAREGADGATTRKIADEAKAPLASLHYCFQNKENLLLAVFEQLSDELPVGVDLSEDRKASLGQVAERLLTRAMRWCVEHPVRTRAMLEILLWAERYDPELSAGFYKAFYNRSEDHFRQADMTLSDEELHSTVRVAIALVDGLSLQMLTSGDKGRTLRDTATACAMLRAFLGEAARNAA
ncbi:helix-turn-helix domain-containing protein [Streptomyces sp. NPDC051320]|uniref:TetR/AcrR family transcriptional regulator n=1 Tax=Streptomyces sp. NPDC051320 TaxID=3154644 RepID=UPI0034461053